MMQIRMRVLALALVGLTAGGFVAVQPRAEVDPALTATVLEPVYAPPAEEVDEHTLRPGETLSEVLGRASLGRSDVNALLL
ncbi:MAG TPA: hypothetical protein VK966_00495, partial [Longimicrobiales bacterium]|nr:hypothetical protein [Longimicrobiales bacterium]